MNDFLVNPINNWPVYFLGSIRAPYTPYGVYGEIYPLLGSNTVEFNVNIQNLRMVYCTRQLTEDIPNWVYYPQLGISYRQFVTSQMIGNWGFFLWLCCHDSEIPNH